MGNVITVAGPVARPFVMPHISSLWQLAKYHPNTSSVAQAVERYYQSAVSSYESILVHPTTKKLIKGAEKAQDKGLVLAQSTWQTAQDHPGSAQAFGAAMLMFTAYASFNPEALFNADFMYSFLGLLALAGYNLAPYLGFETGSLGLSMRGVK